MKILNRPMFRMGGPIKEGIMNGIQEPKRGRVDGPGSYAGRNEAELIFEKVSKGYDNPIIDQSMSASSPYLRGNNKVNQKYLQNDDGQTTKNIISNFSGSINQVPKPAYTQDEWRFKKEVDRVNQNIKKRNFIENMNVDDKYIDGYNDQTGQKEKVLNVNYGKDKTLLLNEVTPPVNTKSGENPFNLRDDGDPKQVGGINENPSGLETEKTPLTKKQKTDNILEMLGYDKAKKSALYDAMINAGQRISRTGLGADNLVSDVIADTSRSYDKPEKLREAANLMRVQQDLKLDQIAASKDNRPNEQKLAEYYQSKDGGGYSQEVALRMSRKLPVTMSEYFAASKATNDTAKLYDATRAATEDGKLFGENVDYMGKIDVKKYGNISKFLSSSPADGVYNILGKAIVVKGNDIITEVVVQPKVDSKGWFKKSE